MDQMYQLQRQIQDLRQEVNNISQVASQLQHSEANNAAQLQRLHQHETMATQQLQAIQQICSRLSQDVNAISNVAQQVTAQMTNRPFTSGQFGAGVMSQPSSGQFGTYSAGISTGFQSPTQFGSFGAQFGANRSDEFSRNQQISQMAANRYGMGLNTPDYATNQYISNMANQGALGYQGSLGAGAYGAGTIGAGLSQTGYANTSTGNFSVQPSHPVQTSQYGTVGFAGSQYAPVYSASHLGTASQPGSGIFGGQSTIGMGAQNMGRYSNF